MSYLEVFILALIEGLTEFLPVSSTGHLILASAVFNINEDVFVKNFNIIIQFGAILAVLFEYRSRFRLKVPFYKTLFLAFLPAAVIGVLVKDKIDAILGSVTVVAVALIAGGVLLLFIDKIFMRPAKTTIDKLKPKNAIVIGLVQCLAFIPGVSRAAATIIGGQIEGLSRQEATEFSFFLAVPTIAAAALYKSLKIFPTIQSDQLLHLALGTVLSFVFALIAIRFFIRIVGKYGLKYFGLYRIVLGVVVLIWSLAA